MAFFKGSWYQNLPVFDPPAIASQRAFRGVRARPIADPEPVLEHAISTGDRLDSLGHHYYSNPRDWRRLADCNPEVIFPEDMILHDDPPALGIQPRERTGEVLLVPRRREGQR